MDTAREKEINIGTSYKFDPLGYGECLVNNKWKSTLQIEEGDFVYFSMRIGDLLNDIILKYNKQFDKSSKKIIYQIGADVPMNFPCKVKGFTKETYGKIPISDIDIT